MAGASPEMKLSAGRLVQATEERHENADNVALDQPTMPA